jgi:hypothetical protein
MPEPTRNVPFVHRLPTDVAAQIHGTAALDTRSPRRRLVVLVPGRVVDASRTVTRDVN